MKYKKALIILAIVLVALSLIAFASYYLFFPKRSDPSVETDPPLVEKRDPWIERMLATEDCPVIEKPEYSYDGTLYEGKLIDSHLHMPVPMQEEPEPNSWGPNEPPNLGKDIWMSEIVCTLEGEGTDSGFTFFSVFTGIDEQLTLDVVNRTMELYPDLFIPFINPPGSDQVFTSVDANTLERLLNVYPGLFVGYGEISIHMNDEPAVSPTDQRLKDIYDVIEKEGIPPYFHPANGHASDLSDALSAYPNIDFIVHGEGVENEIGDLMAEHDNIFFTVNDLYGDLYLLHDEYTAEDFLNELKDFEPLLEIDMENWKGLIEAHPDQFMWGTDRGGAVAWSFDPQVGLMISDYGRAFISKLDPDVQERFAYGNAQSLFK